MRKYKLIFLPLALTLILTSAKAENAKNEKKLVFKQTDFYTSCSIQHKSEEELTLKADSGIFCGVQYKPLNTTLLLTASESTSGATFSEWKAIFSEPQKICGNTTYRYGAKISASPSKLSVKADLLLGTLVFSKSISRLTSPALSEQSALCRPVVQTFGLGAKLPSYTSAKKANALAVNISPARTSPFFPNIQFAWRAPNVSDASGTSSVAGDFFVNLSNTFSLSKHIPAQLTASLTMANIYIEKKLPSQWFPVNQYFPSSSLTYLLAESSLLLPHVKANASFSANENPAGTPLFWFRTQDSFSIEGFTLCASLFASDSGIYTSDGTRLRTLFQAELNPQYTKDFSGGTFSAALLARTEKAETAKRFPEMYRKYSGEAAAKLSVNPLTLNLQLAAKTDTLETASENISFSVKTTVSLKTRHTKCSLKCAYSESDGTDKFSLTQGIALPPVLYAQAGFNARKTDSDWKVKDCTASLNIKTASKRVKWTGKMMFFLTF